MSISLALVLAIVAGVLVITGRDPWSPMRAGWIALALLVLHPTAAAAAASVSAQSYAACIAAGALHGYHLPRLCDCVARAVAASHPASRAAATTTGYAAARVCVVSTGVR